MFCYCFYVFVIDVAPTAFLSLFFGWEKEFLKGGGGGRRLRRFDSVLFCCRCFCFLLCVWVFLMIVVLFSFACGFVSLLLSGDWGL